MKFLKTHYGRAIEVIPSDTVNIPNPAGLGAEGNATGTATNRLIDSSASFTTNLIGAVAVNPVEKKIANVIGFDSGELLLDASIFTSGEAYQIYNSDNNQGCSIYIPAQEPASIKVLTVGGDIIEFIACGDLNSSIILPVSVLKVFETDTALTNLVALW